MALDTKSQISSYDNKSLITNYTLFGSRPQMERIVRPFLIVDSKPYDPPPVVEPLPGEGSDAYIAWGAPSRFISPQITQPVTSSTSFGGGGYRVEWPDDTKKNKSKVKREYTETSRTVDTIRIENPEDKTQYVMVERIEEIEFRAPDGSTVVFKLNNS